MKVVITKTNHDTWHRCRDFNTLEQLLNYIYSTKEPCILQPNEFFHDDLNTIAYCYNTTLKDASVIAECDWECEIYNDYRE